MAETDSRQRLGRGLAALIGEAQRPADPGSAAIRADRRVPIEQIRANASNPRRQFPPAELEELAQSIRAHGLVQPIVVRPVAGKEAEAAGTSYEIIAGERRWRAAQLAQLHEIPVVIREADDREALELAIIENVQRSDLNPVEEAQGFQQLIDGHGYSQAELGQVLSKSRSHIANTLRLLKLPESVREMLVSGMLSAGHARALITVDDADSLAKRIVREGLSVRQAEILAQNRNDPEKSGHRHGGATESRDADIVALERELETILGLTVRLRHKSGGGGELRIGYRDVDQLDALCNRLRH